MLDYSIDDEMERKNQKSRTRTGTILLILFCVFVAFILVFFLVLRPKVTAEMALEVANKVYQSVSDMVKNNDRAGYVKLFAQTPDKEELFVVSNFSEKSGDQISFTLSNPKVSIYPSGMSEISIDVSKYLRFRGKEETNRYGVFILKRGDNYCISWEQYNDSLKRYLSPLPSPSEINGL